MILYYVVTRDVGSGVFFKVYQGLDTRFTDSGLQIGSTYRYKVKAYNLIGFGLESSIVTAIAGSLPNQISTQRIVLQSQTNLTIGWDALTIVEAGGLPVLNYLVISDNSDYIMSAPVQNGNKTTFSKSIQLGN